MDTATQVKQRIAELTEVNRRLATDLDVSLSTLQKLKRERDELLRQVQHADNEVQGAYRARAQDQEKLQRSLQERDELIRDLDGARRRLTRDVRDLKKELDEAQQGLTLLARHLEHAERERDRALRELGEATSAFVDIRDQLRSNLSELGDADAGGFAN